MKTLTKLPKTITFSLPLNTGKEVLAAAKEDHKTVNEWIKDAVHRNKAKKLFHKLATQGQKYAKKKGLTPKDFGGSVVE